MIDAEVRPQYKRKYKPGLLNTRAIRAALRRCKGIRILPHDLFCVDTLGEMNTAVQNPH